MTTRCTWCASCTNAPAEIVAEIAPGVTSSEPGSAVLGLSWLEEPGAVRVLRATGAAVWGPAGRPREVKGGPNSLLQPSKRIGVDALFVGAFFAARLLDQVPEHLSLSRQELGPNLFRGVFQTSGEERKELEMSLETRQNVGELDRNRVVGGISAQSIGERLCQLFVARRIG